MGQQPEGTAMPSPQWFADLAFELAKRLQTQTPTPAQVEQPELRNEDPQLAGEAERLRREALERRTGPAPEEKTTCLHAAKERASSAPCASTESTEEELTPGALSSLAKMAADDREILERKRAQRLTLSTKPRT